MAWYRKSKKFASNVSKIEASFTGSLQPMHELVIANSDFVDVGSFFEEDTEMVVHTKFYASNFFFDKIFSTF